MARIALLTDLHHDNPTTISVLGGLARAYRKRGHKVVAAGMINPLGGSSGPAPILGLGGAEVLRLNAETMPRQFRRLFQGVDRIHWHTVGYWNPVSTAAMRRACAAARAPLGLTFQDFGNRSGSPVPKPRERQEFVRLASFARECRWVSVLSSYQERLVAGNFPELAGRLHVVPNGFDPKEGRGRFSSAGRPFALCVSRLMSYKGIDILLMAWRDIAHEAPGWDLVVCGPDQERGRYQRLAEELGLRKRVHFSGEVDRRRMWKLTQTCRIFVLPSRHESFGLSALEAMACGKAVLATRTGPADYIADGFSGLLAPPMDIAALAMGLKRLLSNAPLRRRLGDNARRTARAFTWDAAADRYLELMGLIP